MVLNFFEDYKNVEKIIKNVIIFLVLNIIGIIFFYNSNILSELLEFLIGAIYFSTLIILGILSIFTIYIDWFTNYIINEIHASKDKENVIVKYKIWLPIKREFDVGYITKKTSFLSNILNVLGTLQMIILIFVFGFTYEIYKNYNFLGVIVACFANICILTMFLMIDIKNNMYIKFKKIILAENIKTNNISSYENIILKNKYKMAWIYLYITSIFVEITTLFIGTMSIKNQITLGMVFVISSILCFVGILICKKDY